MSFRNFQRLAIVTLALLICACGRKQEAQQTAPTTSKLKVVTTVAPITSIVENVGGDKLDVAGIIPEGVNSHTFEPIPSDSKLLAQADLMIFNGLDLETPTLNLAKANLKQRRGDFYPSAIKPSSKATTSTISAFPKHKGHPNPHLWLNPEYAMRYASLVRDELIRIDPKNKAAYEAQRGAVHEKTRSARSSDQRSGCRRFLQIIAACSPITTLGPTFARRYGFQVIGAVQPSDFADPSPKEVMRLIDQIRKEKVPAVFGSEVFPSPVLEQIAREAKSRYIDKLRDDELPGKPGDRAALLYRYDDRKHDDHVPGARRFGRSIEKSRSQRQSPAPMPTTAARTD